MTIQEHCLSARAKNLEFNLYEGVLTVNGTDTVSRLPISKDFLGHTSNVSYYHRMRLQDENGSTLDEISINDYLTYTRDRLTKELGLNPDMLEIIVTEGRTPCRTIKTLNASELNYDTP